MKLHPFVLFLMTFTFFGLHASKAQESQETLQGQAKISQAQAEKIAKDKTGVATVRGVDLAKNNARGTWSVDVAKNKQTKDLVSVDVDAKNGKVLAVAAKKDTDSQQRSKPRGTKTLASQPYFGFATTRKCCWRSDTCCNHRGVCCPGGK